MKQSDVANARAKQSLVKSADGELIQAEELERMAKELAAGEIERISQRDPGHFGADFCSLYSAGVSPLAAAGNTSHGGQCVKINVPESVR